MRPQWRILDLRQGRQNTAGTDTFKREKLEQMLVTGQRKHE